MALDFQVIPYSKDSVLLLFSWRDTYTPVDILAFTVYLHISVFNCTWLSHEISLSSNLDLSASGPKGSESYQTARHTALWINGNLPYTPKKLKPTSSLQGLRVIIRSDPWAYSLSSWAENRINNRSCSFAARRRHLQRVMIVVIYLYS